jgi:hypothetical protein
MPSQTSDIYQLALKHMEKDEKQLPIEIKNLNNMLAKHNNLISNMESHIINLVKSITSFNKSPVLTNSVVYDHDYALQFVSRIWISCKDEKNMIQAISKYVEGAKPRAENGYFVFENLPVAEGDPKNLNTVKDTLYDILKDQTIIKYITDLKASTTELNSQIEKIRELMKPIVDSIDQDLYNTRIKGCCKNLTLLRKI